jgi:ElaB/YqjD/DUF883 family membrane-anchored ribosome-binding protein
MTSFQSNYQGQAGWNDCAPDNFVQSVGSRDGKRSVSASSRRAYPSASASGRASPDVSQPYTATSGVPHPPSLSSRPPSTGPPSSRPPSTGPPSSRPPSTGPPSSRPPSSQPLPADPQNNSQQSPTALFRDASASDNATEQAAVSVEQVTDQLQQLLARGSSLSERELSHYRSRLATALSTLEDKHLCVIKQSLDLALEDGNTAGARDVLVQHSLYNSGTATWLVPLRRLVESVN